MAEAGAPCDLPATIRGLADVHAENDSDRLASIMGPAASAYRRFLKNEEQTLVRLDAWTGSSRARQQYAELFRAMQMTFWLPAAEAALAQVSGAAREGN